MAWKECMAAITAAAGRPLSEDEIDGIATAVQLRLQKKLAEGMTPRDAASAAGKEISGEMALKAMLAKRDAYNNVLIAQDLRARVEPGKEVLSERSVLSGRQA